MSDWKHDLQRIADKVDPAGARARARVNGCFFLFVMIPISMIALNEFQSRQKKVEWSKKSKTEQEVILKKEAVISYEVSTDMLNNYCIPNKIRRKSYSCSYYKKHFLQQYCPLNPLSKYILDLKMCAKLKSSDW
jgi:hypothetical protein